jgi:hypothetical protein
MFCWYLSTKDKQCKWHGEPNKTTGGKLVPHSAKARPLGTPTDADMKQVDFNVWNPWKDTLEKTQSQWFTMRFALMMGWI